MHDILGRHWGNPNASRLRSRTKETISVKPPVFHDDQHGTAIIVAAAVLNGLVIVGKRMEAVKLVVSGAGAAALACADLLVDLRLPRHNIWLTDLAGVVWKGRTELMDPDKAHFAQETDARTLSEVISGADLFQQRCGWD